MKTLLFLSRSKLSLNLLQAVGSLVAVSFNVQHFEDLTGLDEVRRPRKPFDVVLVDWNILAPSPEKILPIFKTHHLLQAVPKILLHPYTVKVPKPQFAECGFGHIYSKPILAEDLAVLLTRALQSK